MRCCLGLLHCIIMYTLHPSNSQVIQPFCHLTDLHGMTREVCLISKPKFYVHLIPTKTFMALILWWDFFDGLQENALVADSVGMTRRYRAAVVCGISVLLVLRPAFWRGYAGQTHRVPVERLQEHTHLGWPGVHLDVKLRHISLAGDGRRFSEPNSEAATWFAKRAWKKAEKARLNWHLYRKTRWHFPDIIN